MVCAVEHLLKLLYGNPSAVVLTLSAVFLFPSSQYWTL